MKKLPKSKKPAQFEAKGEVITFDGFLRVYGGNKDELLPKLQSGDEVNSHDITARQTFTRPPARYTEGSLVKKLEELGIGRRQLTLRLLTLFRLAATLKRVTAKVSHEM